MPMQVKSARSESDKASRCRISSGFHRLVAIENQDLCSSMILDDGEQGPAVDIRTKWPPKF